MGRPRKFVEPVTSLRVRLPQSLHERLKSEIENTGQSLNDLIISKLSVIEQKVVPAKKEPKKQPSVPEPRPSEAVPAERLFTPSEISFDICNQRDARHPVHATVDGIKTCLQCGATIQPDRFGWQPPE